MLNAFLIGCNVKSFREEKKDMFMNFFILMIVVFSNVFLGGCTSITRVENFNESELGSEVVNYYESRVDSHVKILINNGREKHYAHGLLHIPLFPTILFFSDDSSSLDNDLMIIVTVLKKTKINSTIKKVLVNNSSRFINVVGDCREGINFVSCHFNIPVKANLASRVEIEDFSFTSSGIESNMKNFLFNKGSGVEWRFIRGSSYSRR
jgi:hypothetical protein